MIHLQSRRTGRANAFLGGNPFEVQVITGEDEEQNVVNHSLIALRSAAVAMGQVGLRQWPILTLISTAKYRVIHLIACHYLVFVDHKLHWLAGLDVDRRVSSSTI